MTALGILLYLCPVVAFILLKTATKHHSHRLPMIILLSMAFVAAVLLVYDYLFCVFAFAELSPIFGIEYSYEPHDSVIAAAFANLVISVVWIPICIVRYIHFRKKIEQKKKKYLQSTHKNLHQLNLSGADGLREK